MLITVEGVDESLRYTLIRYICSFFLRGGFETLEVGPFGESEIGVVCGSALKEVSETLDPCTELLLNAAYLRQVVSTEVACGTSMDQLVIVDKYVDALWAFYGGNTDIGYDTFMKIADSVVGSSVPDITFLLVRDQSVDERSMSSDEYKHIQDRYLDLAERNPLRIRVIDANQSWDKVEGDVFRILLDLQEVGMFDEVSCVPHVGNLYGVVVDVE